MKSFHAVLASGECTRIVCPRCICSSVCQFLAHSSLPRPIFRTFLTIRRGLQSVNGCGRVAGKVIGFLHGVGWGNLHTSERLLPTDALWCIYIVQVQVQLVALTDWQRTWPCSAVHRTYLRPESITHVSPAVTSRRQRSRTLQTCCGRVANLLSPFHTGDYSRLY